MSVYFATTVVCLAAVGAATSIVITYVAIMNDDNPRRYIRRKAKYFLHRGRCILQNNYLGGYFLYLVGKQSTEDKP